MAKILEIFEQVKSENGTDGLIRNMYDMFNDLKSKPRLKSSARDFMDDINSWCPFDEKIYENFAERFWGIFDVAEEKSFENFKEALMSSTGFMLLRLVLFYQLKWIDVLDCKNLKSDNDEVITLKSSNEVVYKMDKMAAITESVVLKDLIDSTGGRDEIPVPIISGDILSKVISFCEKEHHFLNLSKSVGDRYKAWITGFLNTNQTILSDLHQAADFLHIPSLLDFTSQAVGDHMKGKTPEEKPEWAFA